MFKTIGTIAVVVLLVLAAAILIAGQLNLLSGRRPADLGVKEGKLKPPRAAAWNTVSSQAALHKHTDYHMIAPLAYQGDGRAAFARLTSIVRAKRNANIVTAPSRGTCTPNFKRGGSSSSMTWNLCSTSRPA
jgi:hypothetical protein